MVRIPFPLVRPWVSTAARFALAGVFVYSGLQKATHPVDSVMAVRGYRLLPESAAEIVGYGLPFLELALAALLLVGFGTRVSAAVSVALFLVFIAGVASAWARGLTIDCGCFGGGGTVDASETHYLGTLLRDAGLAALAAWVTAFPPGRIALDTLLTGADRDEHEEEEGGTADGGADTAASAGDAMKGAP